MAKKYVVRSLKEVLENPEMRTICNRSENVDDLVKDIIKYNTPDLYEATPSGADTDTGIVDLDLSTFLSALSERKAVIVLPQYKSGSVGSKKADEVVLDKDNRKGSITGLISNKDFFNFSIQILDMNVMKTNGDKQELGAFRTYTVFRFGEWYQGWNRIEFVPTADENDFIDAFNLHSKRNGNTIVFDRFVHPDKKDYIFTKNYFLLKAFINRVEEEARHFKAIEQNLRSGFGDEKPKAEYIPGHGEKVSVKKDSFTLEIDIPDFVGDYPVLEASRKSWELAKERYNWLQYTILPVVRYHSRCMEFAFYEYNLKRNADNASLPSWIKNAEIKEEKIKKTSWNRLIYGQPGVGQRGFGIRYRLSEKSTQVDKDSI